MSAMPVLILGGSGMLGSMLVDWLSRDPALKITATARECNTIRELRPCADGTDWVEFSVADQASTIRSLRRILGPGWVINTIGIIKPFLHEDRSDEVERAVIVNALFPYWLAKACRECGARVLQIATDCVYSGTRGGYREEDLGASRPPPDSWRHEQRAVGDRGEEDGHPGLSHGSGQSMSR